MTAVVLALEIKNPEISSECVDACVALVVLASSSPSDPISQNQAYPHIVSFLLFAIRFLRTLKPVTAIVKKILTAIAAGIGSRAPRASTRCRLRPRSPRRSEILADSLQVGRTRRRRNSRRPNPKNRPPSPSRSHLIPSSLHRGAAQLSVKLSDGNHAVLSTIVVSNVNRDTGFP